MWSVNSQAIDTGERWTAAPVMTRQIVMCWVKTRYLLKSARVP